MDSFRKLIFKLWLCLAISVWVVSCTHFRSGSDAGGSLTSTASCWSRRSLPSMGTFIQIELLHACGTSVEADFVKAQGTLDEIELSLSRYLTHSDISRWNRGERDFEASPHFLKLRRLAARFRQRTLGYFEVASVGVEGAVVYDFDGVGKGYAVDLVADDLAKYQAFHINFSGNSRWKRADGSRESEASSGDTHRAGQIKDPVRNKIVRREDEVKVQGPSAMWCDVFSTAHFAASENGRQWMLKENPLYRVNYRVKVNKR